MTLAEDFEDFVRLLNLSGVEYMIVGGYALAFHGKPRHTGDMDIWINVSEENALCMMKVIESFGLKSLGFQKEDFLREGIITQIGYPPLRIDILNTIDGIEFNEAVRNMQKVDLEHDLTVNYIGLDDLIKNKQASARPQDKADIRTLMRIKKQQTAG